MERKHIVIAGEDNINTLPLTLMLESKKMKVSVYEYRENIINSFLVKKSTINDVDLIIIGTLQTNEEIIKFAAVDTNPLFDNLPWVFLFLIPAVTMASIA